MSEKRILDEETRKQLLGYVPFSVDVSTLFTPEEFNTIKDTSIRPIFTVRSLNQAELAQLKKNAVGMSKDTTPEAMTEIANKNTEILKNCILGWVQLYDAGTGEEIPYDADKFKTLPSWMIRSIMGFVRKISGLETPDELGLK